MSEFLRSCLRNNPITVTGRMLVIAVACSFLAIIDNTLVGLFSHLIWILLPGFLLGLTFRPKLKVRVEALEVVHVGDEFQIAIRLENLGTLDAFDLVVRLDGTLQGVHVLEPIIKLKGIEGGETLRVLVKTQATQRGVFELRPIQVASLFPLGLFRFLASYSVVQSIVVAPRVLRGLRIDDEIREQSTTAEGVGGVYSQSSFEYSGGREYQPGMHVRRWDFASWAKLGKPIVREFSGAEECRVAIVVDNLRSSGMDPIFERILSYSAGVIEEQMLEQGVEVSLFLGQSGESPVDATTQDLLELLAAEPGATGVIHWKQVVDQILTRVSPNTRLVFLLRNDSIDAALLLTELSAERDVIVRPITNPVL